jgi:hyperosmotically inducible periplasmic protein
MKKHLTVRNATLVAALATVAATAWATSETFTSPYRAADTITAEEAMAKPAAPVAAPEAVAPAETVVATEAAPAAPVEPAAPVAQRIAAEPPVIVQDKAMTVDERIQANVIDRIAQMQNVSGKVGVVSNDAVVTLTGLVTTGGQAYRIGKVAYSVDGVRHVDNQIRAKIGGSV